MLQVRGAGDPGLQQHAAPGGQGTSPIQVRALQTLKGRVARQILKNRLYSYFMTLALLMENLKLFNCYLPFYKFQGYILCILIISPLF